MVVTDTTSSHDYVSGISGVLTPKPYDVSDMKLCLAEMMSKDKGELMYMGLMNAEHVRNELCERVMGERISRFVEKIMNED